VTIFVWISAFWIFSSLIAGPLIARDIGYGLADDCAPMDGVSLGAGYDPH